MLIRFFSSTFPSSFLTVVILNILVFIPKVFLSNSTVEISAVMPLSYIFITVFSNSIIQSFLSLFLILIVGFMFYRISNNHELLKKNSLLPFYFVTLILSCSANTASLLPSLLGLIFVVISLNKLFLIPSERKIIYHLLDIGILISIATLFHAPYISLVLLVFYALITNRTFEWREWLVFTIGLCIPYIFSFLLASLTNQIEPFLILLKENFEIGFITVNSAMRVPNSILGITLMISSIISIPIFFSRIGINKTKTKKNLILVLWLLFYGFINLLFDKNSFGDFLVFIALPSSIILSVYFSNHKVVWFGNLFFILLNISFLSTLISSLIV